MRARLVSAAAFGALLLIALVYGTVAVGIEQGHGDHLTLSARITLWTAGPMGLAGAWRAPRVVTSRLSRNAAIAGGVAGALVAGALAVLAWIRLAVGISVVGSGGVLGSALGWALPVVFAVGTGAVCGAVGGVVAWAIWRWERSKAEG